MLFRFRYVLAPILGVLIMSSMSSCQPSKFTPATYSKRMIMVGSGGGFTGFVTTYTFLDNGQLFMQTSTDKDPKEMTRQKKKQAKEMFRMMDAMDIQNSEFQHPGNMYTFVQLQEGKEAFRIIWGDDGYQAPEPAQALYDSMMVMIKDAEVLTPDPK